MISQNTIVPPPESQHQRWLKYGANVLLTSIVVIVLSGLVIYLAETHARRIDTTVGGTQSLRPQTVDYLKKLNKKIRVIAVYPKLKSDSSTKEQDFYTPVSDLLNDFAAASTSVSVEMIDPDTQRSRFNELVSDVTNNYGGQVNDYKALIDDAQKQAQTVIKFTTDEASKFKELPIDQVKDEQLQQELAGTMGTLLLTSKQLGALKDAVDSDLNQQIPSYKDAVTDVDSAYSVSSKLLGAFGAAMQAIQKIPDLPKEFGAYAPDAAKRVADTKKIVDDIEDRIVKLPQLTELNEFRNELKTKSILIMVDHPAAAATTTTSPSSQPDNSGPGYKILQFTDVWKLPEASRIPGNSGGLERLNFTAEQQITASIATMTAGKPPMVVFVRAGGPPVTTMSPDGQPGYFADAANRLREYNFDVQEKDISGQSQQNPEQSSPEPTEDQLKTAIWVVLDSPSNPMMGPSPVGSQVAQHLADGGSALVLVDPGADPLTEALNPFGIKAQPDFLMVHDVADQGNRRATDQLDAIWQQNQFVFLQDQYGDHPMVSPLLGLGFLNYMTSPVSISKDMPPGVKAKPLMPMPLEPHTWASSTAQQTLKTSQGDQVYFNPKADPEGGHPIADMDNSADPDKRLYSAAASEKNGGGRVVVFGSIYFPLQGIINFPDSQRPGVIRCPGNGEFFMDSVFWLAHMDNMLAISPHALEVARIGEMSAASQAFWRIGVLTAGLPALVILAGILTYFRRRD